MELGDASDEEAPPEQGSNEKFEGADCFDAPRVGE